ncbi:hypothetical protein BC629DRAFT_1440150 [Irpex lacteus]|nr:hypothetical protein BC629DRAFT_1440150 [Irpex lacteus]
MGVGGLSSVRMNAGRLIRVCSGPVLDGSNKAVIEKLKNCISSENIKSTEKNCFSSMPVLDKQSISKDMKKVNIWSVLKDITVVTEFTYCNNKNQLLTAGPISIDVGGQLVAQPGNAVGGASGIFSIIYGAAQSLQFLETMHGGQVAGELVGVSGVFRTTCATYGIPRLCDQLPAVTPLLYFTDLAEVFDITYAQGSTKAMHDYAV